MTQTSLLDQIDVCENRHRGNPESIRAHEKVINTKREIHNRIMNLVTARGEYGATSHEVARALGKQLHCISGRLAELKMVGKLIKTEETRNGAAVLRAS